MGLPLWLNGKPLHCSAYGLRGCQAAEGPEFKSWPGGLSVYVGQLVHIQRIIAPVGTEGSTVSSLICDRWLMLGKLSY